MFLVKDQARGANESAFGRDPLDCRHGSSRSIGDEIVDERPRGRLAERRPEDPDRLAGVEFLAEREGQQLASQLLTITDDPLLPGRLGSRPFDGEGVTSRRVPIFEAGTFRNFLFDSVNARRLGRKTTGALVLVP